MGELGITFAGWLKHHLITAQLRDSHDIGEIMKGRRWKTHIIFDCCDCDKRWENYLTAQQVAKKHAEKYGHNVRGEIGIAVYYDGGARRNYGTQDS